MRLRPEQQEDFRSFVLARSSALLRTAHLLTGDRGHAEDLLQQALERLARHWGRIDGEPDAYVRRTLVNLATDRWRVRARRPAEAGAEDLAQVAADDDAHGRLEDRLDLVRALRTLPPRQRAVLVLRYFDDLSEAETARLMGCSVSTVGNHVTKGLAALRTLLAPGTDLSSAARRRP
jgi:RNA polymerase sigma-70 factor (sigma-E family)